MRAWNPTMAALKLVFDILNEIDEEEDDRRLPMPKKLIPKPDPLDVYTDAEFKLRFRMEKESVMAILPEIHKDLMFTSQRNCPISPLSQFLLTLRMYARGSFSLVMRDFKGVSKSSAHRILHRVTSVICQRFPNCISMPKNVEQLQRVQKVNFDLAGFPNVLGVIDGTHVKIKSPGGEQAKSFRNQKGYFSINIQCIGSGDLKIMDAVARWPGSTPDATIYELSRIKSRIERGEFGNTVLLGDTAYPLSKYLMTPLESPSTPAEIIYNESQAKTRNVLERIFVLWKRRFPIIGLGTLITVEKFLPIIISTIILHNILRDLSDDPPPDDPDVNVDWNQILGGDNDPEDDFDEYAVDETSRQRFIDYFSNNTKKS